VEQITLHSIIKKWPKEMQQLSNGDIDLWKLPDDLDYELYLCYYQDMPYGTQKARTGDPYEFIYEKLMDEPEFLELSKERGGYENSNNKPLCGKRLF